jgi:hypothetical protein
VANADLRKELNMSQGNRSDLTLAKKFPEHWTHTTLLGELAQLSVVIFTYSSPYKGHAFFICFLLLVLNNFFVFIGPGIYSAPNKK